MKKIFYLIVILILLNINIIYSAPAQWGIALNHETKECAGYWAGDEFTQYALPHDWKSYYPNYEEKKDGVCIEGIEKCVGKYQCKVNIIPEPYCWETKEVCENTDWCKEFIAIKTENGECYFNRFNHESCCNQLGYTYVSDNIGRGGITSLGLLQFLFSPIGLLVLILFLLISFLLIKYFLKRRNRRRRQII